MAETLQPFNKGENVLIIGEFFAGSYQGMRGNVAQILPDYPEPGTTCYKVLLETSSHSKTPYVICGVDEIALIEPPVLLGSRVLMLDSCEIVDRRDYAGYVSDYRKDSMFPYTISFVAFNSICVKRNEFSILETSEAFRQHFLTAVEKIEESRMLVVKTYLTRL